MKSILRTALPLFLLAAAATARVAHADPNNPTDNDKAAARPFAIEGLRLAQAGDCKGAVDKLERAEAMVHAPTTAVPLAQCDIQIGKIIAGTEILNHVINETLPPTAPSSWADAKQQAHAILDAAQPRIAKLRIHVDVPPGITPNPEVTVDGQLVPVVLLDNDRPTDPGTHHVTARQSGVGSAEADVTLADGQSKPVSLRLGAGGAVAAAPVGAGAAVGVQAGATVQPMAADPYGQGGAAANGTASAAPAADPDALPVAIEFGARFGFGVPFGGINGDTGDDLDHVASNQIMPLWLNAGVRLADHWYLGSYFSYGVVSIAQQLSDHYACSATGVGCSANDIRFGIEAAYHILPTGIADPWIQLGSGYEWFSFSQNVNAAHSNTGEAATDNYGNSGWEFVNFQAGVDFHLLHNTLGIGPFLGLALTEYVTQSIADPNGDGGTTSPSLTNQTFHEWFMFGARGVYDLKLQ